MPWPCCGPLSQQASRWGHRYLRRAFSMCSLKVYPVAFAGESGYTFGFIIVIMAASSFLLKTRSPPFCQSCKTPTLGNFGLLMRLWSVVLLEQPHRLLGIAAGRLNICRYLMNHRMRL